MLPPRLHHVALAVRAMVARRLLAATVVVVALAPAACLAPTLPLPPPDEPDSVGTLEDGRWEIRGAASPGSTVVAVVERTGRGAVVEDRDGDGRYVVVVDAELCDVVDVWQQDGDETSASTRVVLQPIEDGRAVDPDACVR